MKYGSELKKNKMSKMLYLVPVIYVLALYSVVFVIFYNTTKEANMTLMDVSYWVLIAIIILFNLIFPFFLKGYEYKNFLLKSAIFMKYALIPYFVIISILSFLIYFVLMLTGSLLGIFIWPIIYIMMLAQSSYVFQFLQIQVKNYEITKVEMIVYLLGSIFFISDVITVLVLGIKEKYSKFKLILLFILMIGITCIILYHLAYLSRNRF